jgi:hypothetical protein
VREEVEELRVMFGLELRLTFRFGITIVVFSPHQSFRALLQFVSYTNRFHGGDQTPKSRSTNALKATN